MFILSNTNPSGIYFENIFNFSLEISLSYIIYSVPLWIDY